jgi:tRNA pseudouridine38-40 synthase
VGLVRLTVAYDGTDFRGWQTQPGARTVQGVLEETLSHLLGGREVRAHGAGRTDAGVHARGQVASFEHDGPLPGRAFAPLLNRRLPRDVRVVAAADAAPGFHARHSARARAYSYRLLAAPDLLLGRHAWWPRRPLDRGALETATAVLRGEHDCRSFESSGSPSSSTLCRVAVAGWSATPEGLRLDLEADHFLYHMVRTVVGTALEAATTPDPAAAMRAVLAARDRGAAGPTVPPQGLCLEAVRYGEAA